MSDYGVPLRCSWCGLLHEGGSVPAARGELGWCLKALGREVARLSERVRDLEAAGARAPTGAASWDCRPCAYGQKGGCSLGLTVPDGGCPEFRPAAAAAEAPDRCDHGVPMAERCPECRKNRGPRGSTGRVP